MGVLISQIELWNRRLDRADRSLALRALLFLCFFAASLLLWRDWVAWRDEAHAALIAIHNHSLRALFHAVRYEGTPGLWHLLLWLLARTLGLTPPVLLGLQVAIVLAIGLLVSFVVRLPLLARALLLLNPLMIEYVAFARQYSLAILLLLVFLWQHQRRRDGVGQYLALALLMQTSVHACMVAGGLFLVTLALERSAGAFRWRPAHLAPVLGGALTLLQLIPAADLVPGLRGWRPLFGEIAQLDLGRMLDEVSSGFSAIGFTLGLAFTWTFATAEDAQPTRDWRRWAFVAAGWLVAALSAESASLSAAAGGLSTFLLFGIPRRIAPPRPAVLGVSLLILMLFAVVAVGKSALPRHHGLFVLMLAILLCLFLREPAAVKPAQRLMAAGLAAIALLCCLPNFTIGIAYSLALPRSASATAAEYLDEHHPGRTVVVEPEMHYEPIIFYRKRPGLIYALRRGAFIQYVRWNHPSVDYMGPLGPNLYLLSLSRTLRNVSRINPALLDQQPLLVLSGDRIILPGGSYLASRLATGHRVTFEAVFDRTEREKYLIYRVERDGEVK